MFPSESPVERRARLFSELCELDEAALREALTRLAAEDEALAADVRRMLELDRESLGPLEGLRGEVAGAAGRQLLAAHASHASHADHPSDTAEPPPPERLGAWRVGEKLGAGGMGEVWAAERVEGGFTQRAAVKLVRSGMASREVIARFAVERQLLARLEHPAIARLLDGGIAPDGRPWFAMERIDGLPIDRFAADRGLDIDARLRLFLAVCEAVELAHRSLVVHRDLKPSNILVTADGQPKLLDFGLAKLLEPPPDPCDDGAEPAATRTEMRALTPAYAAPEQIRGEHVTTSTDVYSLGVILYELLTGGLPHRRRSSSVTALAVAVEHETIERPSLRLRRLASGKAGEARQSKRLEGDLDTIVVTALAGEPKRRYASVAALAGDITAHLAGRPIAARPDTAGYRLSKFVRRHRVGVTAAALVLLSLVGGLSVSIVQTRRANAAAAAAETAARRAERVKGFLISVFEQADPNRSRGAEMPARQILAEGVERLTTELGDEPEVRAELYDAVAHIQGGLGLLEEGLASAELAATERARLFGPQSREHAQSLATLGRALLALGRVEEAGKRFAEAVQHFESAGEAPSGVDYAAALSGRAETSMLSGDLPAALADQRRAYEIAAAALGETDSQTLEHLSNVAVLETAAGTFAEAVRTFRQILVVLEPAEGADSPKVLDLMLNLATALDSAGESAEALVYFERVVDGRRRIYGETHPALGQALVISSLRLSRAGRSVEALAALAEARAIYEPLDHPELGSVDNYSGLVLADLGRFAEAEQAFERAAARFAKDLGAAAILTVNAQMNEAHTVSEQGRGHEAAAMFERAVAALRALGEYDNPRLLRARLNWGAALRKLGRFGEAREVLEAAQALALAKLDAGHIRVAEGELELARLDLAEIATVESRAAAVDSARRRVTAAEAITATKTPSPAFVRNLAAAKAELAQAELVPSGVSRDRDRR